MTKPLKAGAKNRGVSKPVPQGGKSKSQKAGRKKAPTRSLEDDKARFKQINERLRALDTTRTKAERERERAERECQDAQKEQAKLQKELENPPPSPFPPRFLPPPPSRSLPPRQSRLPWNFLRTFSSTRPVSKTDVIRASTASARAHVILPAAGNRDCPRPGVSRVCCSPEPDGDGAGLL